MRLAVATGNPGKVREYAELLARADLELVPWATGVDESGASYEVNAILKAEAAAAASGLPAIGDDSGLEVEALGGFPGVRSARVGPDAEARNRILLERLAGHPRPWRARFVCVVALARPGGSTRLFRGERRGEIVEPRGQGGFGYDPIFLLPEAGQTFAQLAPVRKHRLGHRGAAVRLLLESGALDAIAPG